MSADVGHCVFHSNCKDGRSKCTAITYWTQNSFYQRWEPERQTVISRVKICLMHKLRMKAKLLFLVPSAGTAQIENAL